MAKLYLTILIIIAIFLSILEIYALPITLVLSLDSKYPDISKIRIQKIEDIELHPTAFKVSPNDLYR